LSSSSDEHAEELEPDLQQARRTAGVAHNVVVKLKVMGLPQAYDEELASLSTDLGDLWSAHKTLAERLEGFVKSSCDWGTTGDFLVDIRASIDHIAWHQKSVRRPLNRITQYAYRMNSEAEASKESLSE
jgi:hypothetical protein